MFFQVFVIIFFALLTSCNVYSKEINQIPFDELSKDAVWVKLLVYEKDLVSPSSYRSAVSSSDFFFSEEGDINPLAELMETVKALLLHDKAIIDANERAICRFPARFMWLKEKLPAYFNGYSLNDCVNYNEWSHNGSTQSVSLVFATGYLANPASFYGHTFLKFNSSQSKSKSATNLLDVSVNYGVINSDGDNPAEYIIKSLTGGYDAGFSHIDYYFHSHNYGENELRDMWEYELSFSERESQFIVAHAWEMLGKKYTYYFFRKNCAYRIAELLEVGSDIDIKPKNPVYLIPQALIQTLESSQYNGRSLIVESKYYPSRQSKFYNSYNDLNESLKFEVNRLAENSVLDLKASLIDFSDSDKIKIVETLINYYQYILKDDEVDIHKENYRRVLSYRFLLPAGSQALPKPKAVSPQYGRDVSRFAIKNINNKAIGQIRELNIRPAYYDALDGGIGHISLSELSTLNLGVRVADDDVYISYLDVFSVRSLNGRQTGLPDDKGFAWNAKAGFELTRSNSRSPVFRIQGDIGESVNLSDNFVLSAFIGGGVQDKKQGYGAIFSRGIVESHFMLSDKWRFNFRYESRYFIDSRLEHQDIISLIGRYEIDTNIDVRLSYANDGVQELGAELGFYW